jgi:chitin disaccharide deacetylase
VSRKLIITADDYGLSPLVNNAIEECLEAGSVSATCVMTNISDYKSAAGLRRRFANCSIGIHWNLTQGRPILKSVQLSDLTNPDGSFRDQSQFRRRWLLGGISEKSVVAELKAQYEAFYRVLGTPDFWNTHQNFHVLPRLFDICVATGKALRIPAMRCHRRITIPSDISTNSFHFRHPVYWLKGRIIAYWATRAIAHGVLMPEATLNTPGYGAARVDRLCEIVNRISWSQISDPLEIVFHPATSVDPALFGSLKQSRVLEFNALRNPSVATQLLQSGINIVSYSALGASG